MLKAITLISIFAVLALTGIFLGCSDNSTIISSGYSFSGNGSLKGEQCVIDTVAEWAGVPSGSVTADTSLYNLGSKNGPDLDLANMLATEFPENADAIMANYATWSIVEDALEDCL